MPKALHSSSLLLRVVIGALLDLTPPRSTQRNQRCKKHLRSSLTAASLFLPSKSTGSWVSSDSENESGNRGICWPSHLSIARRWNTGLKAGLCKGGRGSIRFHEVKFCLYFLIMPIWSHFKAAQSYLSEFYPDNRAMEEGWRLHFIHVFMRMR